MVLVHGSFSNHRTNWEPVKPRLAQQFTVYAIARRGFGEMEATEWHSVRDEAGDISALLEAINEPVSLLGHSYGAHVALAAAMEQPDHISRLVLYEPPRPDLFGMEAMQRLETLGAVGDWEAFTATFFRDILLVPAEELEELRSTTHWLSIVADAKPSLGDLRALAKYDFRPNACREIQVPVMLQFGRESPRERFLTGALASVLPNVRIEELSGQAHEGMTTAPEQYVESVFRFLLG